mmetsp:Transcript_32427/g.74236  ORF Transcript_32427/g.74236 Transcript_32427/m.74236 type:complete len:135 (+) Transcript_32427:51-455(+)
MFNLRWLDALGKADAGHWQPTAPPEGETMRPRCSQLITLRVQGPRGSRWPVTKESLSHSVGDACDRTQAAADPCSRPTVVAVVLTRTRGSSLHSLTNVGCILQREQHLHQFLFFLADLVRNGPAASVDEHVHHA